MIIARNIFIICCMLPFLPILYTYLCDAWDEGWVGRICFCPLLLFLFLPVIFGILACLIEIICIVYCGAL